MRGGLAPPAAGSRAPLNPVFILFGPTAVGKTAVVERLFGGGRSGVDAEIISADSMQVYRGMNVGTAKPNAAAREALPHHLLDVRNPDEQFNAGDFVRLAYAAARAIAARGKLPVVSGGTGFYINSFLCGLPAAPPSDQAIRAALKKEAREAGGMDALWNELCACDAASAARIHRNDEYRLLRALEVFRLTGKPLSSFKACGGVAPEGRRFIVGLERERGDLYKRIEKRCAGMMRAGLADEAASLFDKGYTPDDPALKAIGYKEFFYKDEDGAWQLLARGRPGVPLARVEELIAQNSRNYAKRQTAYFKNIAGADKFFLDEEDASLNAVVEEMRDALSRFVDEAADAAAQAKAAR
jgi:tRNA dimethylallyltransferase